MTAKTKLQVCMVIVMPSNGGVKHLFACAVGAEVTLSQL